MWRGQIRLVNHLSTITILSYLKRFGCVHILLEYFLNRITDIKYQYLKPINNYYEKYLFL